MVEKKFAYHPTWATRASRRGNEDLHFIMPSLEELALDAAPSTWSGFGQWRGQYPSWTLVPLGSDANSCLTKVFLSWVNPPPDEKPHAQKPSPGMERLDEWRKYQQLRDCWWGQNAIKPFQADPRALFPGVQTSPVPSGLPRRGLVGMLRTRA